MACCSVKWCGKNTKNSNLTKDGISFHRFPNSPELKSKWIDATKRENWFPQKHNVICSRHFTPDCFNNSKKIRLLFKSAVPTQFLPVFNTDKASTHNIVDSQSCSQNQIEINSSGSSHENITPSTNKLNNPPEESPPKIKKINRHMEHLVSSLIKKNKFIKRLQAKNRRQKKLIALLRDTLRTHKCCMTKGNEDLLGEGKEEVVYINL